MRSLRHLMKSAAACCAAFSMGSNTWHMNGRQRPCMPLIVLADAILGALLGNPTGAGELDAAGAHLHETAKFEQIVAADTRSKAR